MNRRVLQSLKQAVLENAGEQVVSLYVLGSFLSNEMIASSDIDLVGIMKPNFDFRREARINRILNKTVRSEHKIDLGTMSYDEFFGGTRKGSVMRHIELPHLSQLPETCQTHLRQENQLRQASHRASITQGGIEVSHQGI